MVEGESENCPWLGVEYTSNVYATAKNEVSIKATSIKIDKLEIHIILQISAHKLIVGGAPMLPKQIKNHNKVNGGMTDIKPLEIIIFRECKCK